MTGCSQSYLELVDIDRKELWEVIILGSNSKPPNLQPIIQPNYTPNYTVKPVSLFKAVFTFLSWRRSFQPSPPCQADALRKGHSLSVKWESIDFVPPRPLFIKLCTAVATASAASCTDAYMACQSWSKRLIWFALSFTRKLCTLKPYFDFENAFIQGGSLWNVF